MEDTLSTTLVVEYCSTHTGYEIQLSHLPILNDVRLLIARKLQAGICVSQILDDVCNNCLDDNNGIGHEELFTRQDILDIGRKLNVHTIQRHSNDLLSVCSWVEEMKELEYNPILVFKPQGEDGNQDTNELKKDDFLLAIQMCFKRMLY